MACHSAYVQCEFSVETTVTEPNDFATWLLWASGSSHRKWAVCNSHQCPSDKKHMQLRTVTNCTLHIVTCIHTNNISYILDNIYIYMYVLYYILYRSIQYTEEVTEDFETQKFLLMPEVSAAYIVSAATWISMAQRFGSRNCRAAHLLRPAYGPGVALAGLNNASPEPESCYNRCYKCYNRWDQALCLLQKAWDWRTNV